MPLRSTMSALIYQTRLMIGDPSGINQVFTDQDIQDAMDMYQFWERYVLLNKQASIQPGGKRIWTDFFADANNWEADVQLVDANYNVLTPTTSDFIIGHWTFSAGVSTGVVWLVGKSYDINASAADVLDMWIGKLKLGYDFKAQGVEYSRSQRIAALQEMADRYRAKAIPMSINMVRRDLNGAAATGDSMGINY